jgi:hypothetical protein
VEKQERIMRMSDDADRAGEIIDRMNESAALLRKPTLQAVGFCHNCGEWVEPRRLFCSVECRDDWQRERDAEARNAGN